MFRKELILKQGLSYIKQMKYMRKLKNGGAKNFDDFSSLEIKVRLKLNYGIII